MTKQPKIEVPRSSFETFFNVVGVLIFTATLLFLFLQYGDLPEHVPGHYNEAGKADRWGSKGELHWLPLIGACLWIGMTILERYPHTFNYINLTEENVEFQYKNGRRMINVLKNEMLILFSYITVQSIRVANGTAEGLGVLFLPIFLLIIFGSLLFFVMKMLRH